MDFDEAKVFVKNAGVLYRAYSTGEVWSAGRMVDAGETIGYFATECEAREACADYELFDFDRDHMTTDIEVVDSSVFGE